MAQDIDKKTINEISNDVYLNNETDANNSSINVIEAEDVAIPITHYQATYELLNNIEENGAIRIVLV